MRRISKIRVVPFSTGNAGTSRVDTLGRLHIGVRTDARATVIALAGELDLASAPALRAQLEDTIGSRVELVILDLRGVDFMDSTGVAVLIRARQAARDSWQRFALVRGGHQVDRLFRITSLDQHFMIVDAPEDLLGGDSAVPPDPGFGGAG